MSGMLVTKVTVEKESDTSEPRKLRRESVEGFGHWTASHKPRITPASKKKERKATHRLNSGDAPEFLRCPSTVSREIEALRLELIHNRKKRRMPGFRLFCQLEGLVLYQMQHGFEANEWTKKLST